MLCSSFSFLLILSSTGLAVPKDSSRVVDHILSHETHFDSDGHHKDYDHEAFLGENEARAFDQLSPEESKKRLGDIVDKIDTDDDGQVSFEELRLWIQQQQKSYIREDVDRQWKSHNPENNTVLKWETYRKLTYGFMDDLEKRSVHKLDDEDTKTYRDMMRRDKRRWEMADKDHDDVLTKQEFTDFLHPEETPHMQSVVVEETLEDIDKDKDGKISLEEYISDMYSSDGKDPSSVPDWVTREREQFKEYRDKNRDGFLDQEEIKFWILPPDYDHSEAEARHLMSESDSNKDGSLSKQEIVDNYDLFVGSQATDFGEALVSHDEF